MSEPEQSSAQISRAASNFWFAIAWNSILKIFEATTTADICIKVIMQPVPESLASFPESIWASSCWEAIIASTWDDLAPNIPTTLFMSWLI